MNKHLLVLASALTFVFFAFPASAAPASVTLSGRVVRDGMPFVGAKVILGSNLSGPTQAVTDADGRYAITVPFGKTYERFEVTRALGTSETIRVFSFFSKTFDADMTIDYAIPGRDVQIDVLGQDGKLRPRVMVVARARLVCGQVISGFNSCSVMSGTKPSDPAGHAHFWLVQPQAESQEILLYPEPGTIYAPTFFTINKTDLPPYGHMLPYAKRLFGHVLDGAGRPIPGASVFVSPNVILPIVTHADFRGAYELTVPVGMRAWHYTGSNGTPLVVWVDTERDFVLP